MTGLTRPDIVGRRILAVLQTPWNWAPKYDVSLCRAFVRLDSGVTFELSDDDAPLHELPAEDAMNQELFDFQFPAHCRSCVGESIDDVVVSDYWPTIGLLLSSQRFLLCQDWGPHAFGLVLTDLGSCYHLSDVRSYFSRG